MFSAPARSFHFTSRPGQASQLPRASVCFSPSSLKPCRPLRCTAEPGGGNTTLGQSPAIHLRVARSLQELSLSDLEGLARLLQGAFDEQFELDPWWWFFELPGVLAYRLRLAGTIAAGHLLQGPGRFATILATAPDGALAGCTNVSLGAVSTAAAAAALGCAPRAVVATISNMAVAPTHRRRGLGRQLVRACREAADSMQPAPQRVLLYAYKNNQAALRLYLSQGLVVTDWQVIYSSARLCSPVQPTCCCGGCSGHAAPQPPPALACAACWRWPVPPAGAATWPPPLRPCAVLVCVYGGQDGLTARGDYN